MEPPRRLRYYGTTGSALLAQERLTRTNQRRETEEARSLTLDEVRGTVVRIKGTGLVIQPRPKTRRAGAGFSVTQDTCFERSQGSPRVADALEIIGGNRARKR